MSQLFGRSLRPLWGLAAGATFLNHGSFGACPIEVLREQDRIRSDMESQPDHFFQDQIIPTAGQSALRAAAAKLAAFVNARESEIAFVENASAGIQAVLRGVPLSPGDHIMITDHTYNAVRLMVEAKCADSGAQVVTVPLAMPASADEVVERFRQAATPAVKLAIIDHITSPTALVMPLAQIIDALHEAGVRVLVDGAHAVGQIPLDITKLRPDWYVSNAHKWLFAPKGSAFLYAAGDVAGATRPNVISHFIHLGFPKSFDYTGTRDNSAWLAIPAALAFFQRLNPAAVWAYQSQLLAMCTELLVSCGAQTVGPFDMCAAMRSFVLPQRRAASPEDAAGLLGALWNEDRIQAKTGVFAGKLLLRVSAQVYVDEDDLHRLHRALDRIGWPGR